MKVFVKYLPGAEELYYKTEGSACADLRYFDADGSKPELAIMPGETVMIHTGVSMWINDPKFTALVFPRSGLGSKGLVLANTVGVIDSDYQGEIMLALKNAGQGMLKIAAGHGQLIEIAKHGQIEFFRIHRVTSCNHYFFTDSIIEHLTKI